MMAKMMMAANTDVAQLVKATRIASLSNNDIWYLISNEFSIPQTVVVDRVVGAVGNQTSK